MGKYGQTASIATDLLITKKIDDPIEAWKIAATQIFPDSLSSQIKSCPRSTFLGLCEDGYIPNVAEGSYTRSQKNKEYAIKALELLKSNPGLLSDKNVLWNMVIDDTEKKQNSQMDIVTTLWKNKLINQKIL